jgi:hypothetical protein
MATPTSLPATFVAGNVLTAAEMNDLRGAFRILQVVRATDTVDRTTTSTSLVDANISVTITPTSATSTILILWTASWLITPGTPKIAHFAITDSSNVEIEGAESALIGTNSANTPYGYFTMFGYDSPATTSATTYKGRFMAFSGSSATVTLDNADRTGQMFAMEISA